MTPIELVDELKKFIKENVKEYDLETRVKEKKKAPAVYSGYLPPKKKDDDISEFPYIIVRYLSEDIDEEDVVNIGLIIGTYSQDEQDGWRDPLNIATRIKIALRKAGALGAYSLYGTIKIDLLEEQPFPQWFATMNLSFNIPNIQVDWR